MTEGAMARGAWYVYVTVLWMNAVVLTIVTLKLALDTLPALRAARAG